MARRQTLGEVGLPRRAQLRVDSATLVHPMAPGGRLRRTPLLRRAREGEGLPEVRVLAIDPGTSCGWAIRDSHGLWMSGVWNLAPPRGSSPGTRYLYLLARLNEILSSVGSLDLVAVEQAHNRGGAATEYANGVVTHVQSWCAERGIEHAKIHSRNAKKLATGKGNASKDEMVDAARAKWPGYTFASDDECDARWIAEAAMKEYGA